MNNITLYFKGYSGNRDLFTNFLYELHNLNQDKNIGIICTDATFCKMNNNHMVNVYDITHDNNYNRDPTNIKKHKYNIILSVEKLINYLDYLPQIITYIMNNISKNIQIQCIDNTIIFVYKQDVLYLIFNNKGDICYFYKLIRDESRKYIRVSLINEYIEFINKYKVYV